jgi:hypothetical protein
MQRMSSKLLSGLMLVLVAGAAIAMSPSPGAVVIGQTTCFRIRVTDKGQSVQQRVDHIQDIAAKYLGGDAFKLTIRDVGDRRHIDVNGEFLVAVTPTDANATGHKSAATLAPLWRDALERAFLQSRARPAPPAVTEPQTP